MTRSRACPDPGERNAHRVGDWTGTWDYEYDDNNRLTGATPPKPVPGQPAGGPYVYDWVGNRLNPPAGDTNKMVYNKADQLVNWPGMHGDATCPDQPDSSQAASRIE